MAKRTYNKANYQKNTNMVAEHTFQGQSPSVSRVKTDGRIGSATPPQFLKGGLTVDNNKKAGPPGEIGSLAARHMSPNHEPGSAWSPRVAKARKMAKPNPKAYANPINRDRPTLKRVRPD